MQFICGETLKLFTLLRIFAVTAMFRAGVTSFREAVCAAFQGSGKDSGNCKSREADCGSRPYFKRVYGDAISGAIGCGRFLKLSAAYEAEQKEPAENAKAGSSKLQTGRTMPMLTAAVIRTYVGITGRTSALVNGFWAEEAHVPDKPGGHRKQNIRLVWNFIGKANLPDGAQAVERTA